MIGPPMPERTRQSIDLYVSHGADPGGFVTAVLENDLRGALGTADSENRAAIYAIVSYCWTDLPADCWGSREAVARWVRERAAEAGRM